MQYLVCRVEALNGGMRQSDLWPAIVDAHPHDEAEQIVFRAIETRWPGYIPKNKEFIVVPLTEALYVNIKPKQEYVAEVRPWLIGTGMSPSDQTNY